MTCAGWDEVEALIDGELSGPRAGAAREHLAGCGACAAGAAALRAERALVAARARLPAPPPPPLSAVLGRARRQSRADAWLGHPSLQGLGLAAAAAILGMFVGRLPESVDAGAPAVTPEPIAGLVCADTAATAAPHDAPLACVEEHPATVAMTPVPPPDVTFASCRRLVLGDDEGSCEPGCEGSCP